MKRALVLLSPLLTLAAVATSGTARAGNEIGLGISYDPRIPVGGLRDLVSGAAFAGVQGRWDYYVLDSFAAGFQLQYHYFQQGSELETIAIENGAVTAPLTRYAYFLSILPTVRYYPWAHTAVRPYVELGAGVTNAAGAVYVSDLSRRTNEGAFVAQPSLGVLWALDSNDERRSTAGSDPWPARRPRDSMFGIAASFAWSFTTASILTATNVNYVGAQLGVYTKL